MEDRLNRLRHDAGNSTQYIDCLRLHSALNLLTTIARQFGNDVLALKDGEIVPGYIGNQLRESARAEASL